MQQIKKTETAKPLQMRLHKASTMSKIARILIFANVCSHIDYHFKVLDFQFLHS